MDRVKILLNKGTPVDIEDPSGYTALHYAARNGRLKICKLLLERGANVNARTRCARATSLHRAASQGHEDVVDFLLKSGADADLLDDDGCTALHRAVLADSVPTCRLLLSKTNLRVANNAGLTAMQLAEKQANPCIISLFEQNLI